MMNNQWNMTDLRVFCQVAKRSSFVGAATDLGISPAYVTKRIAHLESALATTLFHRTTRRVLISDSGETAYAWARKVLDAAEELNQGVAGVKTLPKGPLRISTSLRLGRNHLAPILADMRRQYPELEVWLEVMDRRVDLLGEGFDIDVRMGDVHEPHLIAHHVARNARVLCAAPTYLAQRGHPKTLADLASHDCLMYRDRHQTFGVWRLQGPDGPESVKIRGSMGSNQSDIMHQWALEGLGIIPLASWDVAGMLRDGSLARVLPQYHQSADVWAVTAARLDQSAKLRMCTELLISQLQSGPYALDTSVV